MFGPVWTAIYAMDRRLRLAGLAGVGLAVLPFAVFALQLILNGLWSIVFFRWKKLGGATLEASALWLAIALNIAVFWRIDVTAALLLVPYLAWVSLALGAHRDDLAAQSAGAAAARRRRRRDAIGRLPVRRPDGPPR